MLIFPEILYLDKFLYRQSLTVFHQQDKLYQTYNYTFKKGRDHMPLPKPNIYTVEDIYLLPDGQRAELIDGQIYNMAPPSPLHQKLVALFTTALQNYIKSNGGSCEVYPAPFAVFLNQDSYNYVEPDISVICDPSKMNDKGCNGAPDFIIEIVSPSSQRMDYLTKLFKYRTAGVREYWIVNPMTRIVQVYCFGEPEDSTQYSFDEEISVGIYSDLKICIADLLK